MISASGVADTLRLLVPGFVALSAFYRVGLRSKRTDLQWTVWSVLLSAPIVALVSLTGVSDVNQRLAISLALALIGGLLFGWIWNTAASRFEWLQASTDIRAWDTVLTRSDCGAGVDQGRQGLHGPSSVCGQ